MDSPAAPSSVLRCRRLLADIEAGRVDVVVVYKIDRLSRSLMDFAKLVEVFERHGVTFVCSHPVIQHHHIHGPADAEHPAQSFAQFEREVIGERIRDKFAASRARGMWMGGSVPLGYDVRERKLIVNEAEAAVVRRVFQDFLEIGSATKLTQILRAEGVTTKRGKPINKGDIYKLLNNCTYVGEASHKGNVFKGEHTAIISRELWDAVHADPVGKRREPGQTRTVHSRRHSCAGLSSARTGVLCRRPIRGPRGRLYRYYVSQSVLKETVDTGSSDIVRRVSAAEIETAVINQVRTLLHQPEIIVGTWLAAKAAAPDLSKNETREALQRLDPLWDQLFPAEQARIIQLLVERVEIGARGGRHQTSGFGASEHCR